MKKIFFILIIVCITFIMPRSSFSLTPVKLEVTKETINLESDIERLTYYMSDSKKNRNDKLKIDIQNISGKPSIGLKVKWVIYMEDIEREMILIEAEDTVEFQLKQLESKTIYSKPFEYSYKKSQWGTTYRYERGKKYYGYAVFVYEGDKLVELRYKPEGIKKLLIKDGLL